MAKVPVGQALQAAFAAVDARKVLPVQGAHTPAEAAPTRPAPGAHAQAEEEVAPRVANWYAPHAEQVVVAPVTWAYEEEGHAGETLKAIARPELSLMVVSAMMLFA